MFAQAALNWLTGGSPKPMSALDALQAKYDAEVGELRAALIEEEDYSANLLRAFLRDREVNQATIFELRGNCYELTLQKAEIETELRIMKAARARSNANLIPGGPKAMEKRRRDAATKAMTAVRKAMEVAA